MNGVELEVGDWFVRKVAHQVADAHLRRARFAVDALTTAVDCGDYTAAAAMLATGGFLDDSGGVIIQHLAAALDTITGSS